MRRILIAVSVILLLAVPVSSLDISAPAVPDSAADIMPDEPETFAQGLWELITAVIAKVEPELAEAAGLCLSVIAAGLMISFLEPMTGQGKKGCARIHPMAIPCRPGLPGANTARTGQPVSRIRGQRIKMLSSFT